MSTTNNSQTNFRLIFIGGAPRSGTTLVQRLFNGHPEIYGGPEFDYTPEIADLYSRMMRSIDSGRIDSWLTPEECTHSFREFFYSLFRHKANKLDKLILCEKTPENAEAALDLFRILPEVPFILVIRDPRDVVASIMEVRKKARKRGARPTKLTRDTRSACIYVKRCMENGTQRIEQDPQSVIIFYEDVIKNAEGEIRALFSKLHLEIPTEFDANDTQYEHCKNSKSWKDWETGKTNEAIDPNNHGSYKKKLSTFQIAYIEQFFASNPIISKRYFTSVDSSTQRILAFTYKILCDLRITRILP
jgi:hypothetical protein